ncbi:hypothetical protein DVA86_15455 [Streptomyces armeniacus]|uniref:Uncharacterized protein n=1 Tax=Streptomyces armeniacus TaxID=83291 RepID=A0A345XQD2_9ACTN|nr:hypothetical protein [Streptomyces armeniacus]AXK33848.1 hypothetical protein DVA86_15455 [Streptomyces armeniacus]
MSADTPSGTSPHVRLRVELVVEIADPAALAGAAREQLAADAHVPDAERERVGAAVAADPAEALSYLVDPFDLVKGLPGVELAHASWGSEQRVCDMDDAGDWPDEV